MWNAPHLYIPQVLSNVAMSKRSSMAHVQAHFKRLVDTGRGTAIPHSHQQDEFFVHIDQL